MQKSIKVLLFAVAGLAVQLPASAATQCVPAANPGPCDAFHATIQDAIDAAAAGDTVLVGPGTYAESPNVTKSLILTSNDGRDFTTIDLQTGPTYLGSLTFSGLGTDATVEGFTIEGRDHACPVTLAASNILLDGALGDISVLNNRILVGQVGACTNGDDGIGILTSYTPATPGDSLTVVGNIIEPLTAAGGSRGFYINPGVRGFVFDGNSITGLFTGTSITQAMIGFVTNNLVDGQGLGGRGMGTFGDPNPLFWGSTTFTYNVFTGVVRGIGIFDTNLVHLECNLFELNGWGVEILDVFYPYSPSTISMRYNRFKSNSSGGVNNTSAMVGTVNAEDNYWGAADGPSGIGPGSGDAVLGDVDFDPFLTDSNIPQCSPLAVKLDSLRATWTEAGVVVSWTTLSERDTAGFSVLRASGSRKVDGVAMLTVRPIAPVGNEIQGADYEYLDSGAMPQDTSFYYLEEIDTRGQVTRYGPIAVEPRPSQGTRTRGAVRTR